jgi:hypothetical protein
MPASGTWAITNVQDSMVNPKIWIANFFMMFGDGYMNQIKENE